MQATRISLKEFIGRFNDYAYNSNSPVRIKASKPHGSAFTARTSENFLISGFCTKDRLIKSVELSAKISDSLTLSQETDTSGGNALLACSQIITALDPEIFPSEKLALCERLHLISTLTEVSTVQTLRGIKYRVIKSSGKLIFSAEYQA